MGKVFMLKIIYHCLVHISYSYSWIAMASTTKTFNLSSLLEAVESTDVGDNSKKDLFDFVRSLMTNLIKQDPQMYNKCHVVMEDEVQNTYEHFEDAKTVFLKRIREVVGESNWNQALEDSGMQMN